MVTFEQSSSSEATLSSSDSLLITYEKKPWLCMMLEVQFVSKQAITAREYGICQRALCLTKINLLFSKLDGNLTVARLNARHTVTFVLLRSPWKER